MKQKTFVEIVKMVQGKEVIESEFDTLLNGQVYTLSSGERIGIKSMFDEGEGKFYDESKVEFLEPEYYVLRDNEIYLVE